MRFFTGFFPFLCSSASFYLQIKRYICLCSSRLSNFYLHAYFWKMKVYFISFFFFLKGHSVPPTRLSLDRTLAPHSIKEDWFSHITEVGARVVLNLFWESKGMRLFMEWFFFLTFFQKNKQGWEDPYNSSLHIETEIFYMKTIHTTLVVTTHINILWIIKYVCIKAKIFGRHLFSIMNYMFWESRLFPFV